MYIDNLTIAGIVAAIAVTGLLIQLIMKHPERDAEE